MEYYCYLTNDCNLNCEYCSVLFDCQKNKIPLRLSYPLEELLSFIARIQTERDDPHIRLFFFGGEPTLEFGQMQAMMEGVRDRFPNYDIKFILHTNGLLLERMPQAVTDGLSLVTLSFNYEKIPHHHLKESYFSKVMENLLAFREKSGVPFSARLTVTEKTSLYTEARMVSAFCEYVYFQIENCAAFHDPESFYQTYTFEVELLYRIWKEKLLAGTLENIIPFLSVLKQLLLPERDENAFGCGYNKHQIYIQTDGSCFSCCDNVPEGQHHIGSLQTGIHFGSCQLAAHACGACPYRGLCLGRCGRMHREFSAAHVEEYCRMNRAMFDLFLRDRAELAAALAAHPEFEPQLKHWMVDITELTP